MPSDIELKRVSRELHDEVTAILADTRMDTARKSARLDKLEARHAEVKEHLQNNVRGRKLMGGGNSLEFGDGMPQRSAPGVRGQAPSIMPSDQQIKALFNAATTRQTFRAEVKTATSIGGVADPALLPGILGRTHEPQRVMDFLPATAMSAPAVEYLRHNSTTGTVTTVAPGGLKPELSFNVDKVIIRAAKIAANTAVKDEDLLDYEAFRNYVTVEPMRAIIDTENDQLLNGDGLGTNLPGFLKTSGALTRPIGTDTGLDAVEQGINDIRVGSAFAVADLMVTHPATRSKLRRSKDSQQRYLLNADPSAEESHSLWGIPLVVTTACPVGTVLVANAEQAAMVYVRDGMKITASSTSGNDFVQNLTRFVCEERLALATPRPAAMCIVTGI